MDEHNVRQGTVVDFKTSKYTILYDKSSLPYGNSRTLTKTQPMKVVLPVPMLAAERAVLAIEEGAVETDKLAIGTDGMMAGEAAAPSGAVCVSSLSRVVELRLTSNPVGSRVPSTPTWRWWRDGEMKCGCEAGCYDVKKIESEE